MTDKINLEPLSVRAKALAGAWFGMMRPDTCSGVTLHMRESVPTEDTKAVLAELVAAGVISEAPFNKYGGIVYKPLVDCFDAFLWMRDHLTDEGVNFTIMQPAPGRKEVGTMEIIAREVEAAAFAREAEVGLTWEDED